MKKILWVLAMFFAFTSMAFAAVNLNTATKEELDAVKGIGPAKAQAIIDYRSKNGPFKSVDDLKNVNGFGDKTVAKMRSELSVSGATTVPAAKEEKKVEKPAKVAKKEEAKDSKADKKAAREAKKAEKAAKAEEMKKEPAKEERKDEAKKDAKADKKAAKEAKKAEKAAKKEAAKKAEAEKK